MSKAFVSNPPLPEEEGEAQTEALRVVPPPPTSLKRKEKRVDTEGPKKKAKPSVPLRTGGSLNIGGEDAPPRMTSRRSPRSAAPVSRPAAKPRARASPPSSSPSPTTRSGQIPQFEQVPVPQASEPPKRPPIDDSG